jgi:hypothetical protein
MPTLEDAIALAVDVHRSQIDKAGLPYILHPLRVMLALETAEERIVGVLHDVLEDSGKDDPSRRITVELPRRRGYPEPVLTALDLVTRRDVRRVHHPPAAQPTRPARQAGGPCRQPRRDPPARRHRA